MTELFELSAPRTPPCAPGRQRGRPAAVRAERQPAVRRRRADLGPARRAASGQATTVPWRDLLTRLGVDAPAYVDDTPLAGPPVRALSLAVAQKCNLGCTYCYADGGSFGGPAANMPEATALASVDLLLSEVGARRPGQPRLPRRRAAAQPRRAPRRHRAGVRAGRRARRSQVTFSITTNGTLLTADDGDFFEEYGFAVTVSLDGIGPVHDRLRPFLGGRGSYERVVARVAPLLERQRRMQVSARVTVTPSNLGLTETLDAASSASGSTASASRRCCAHRPAATSWAGPSWRRCWRRWSPAGQEFERRVLAGERYPFANAVTALRELHRGTHRPYPCGAGAGYLGVAADGDLAACHRFVGDPGRGVRQLTEGIDRRRAAAVAGRAARARAGALQRLLGPLPVRRRLPPRGDRPRPAGVRLHPGLAALVDRGVRAAVGRPARLLLRA